jgi:hypothetical protein
MLRWHNLALMALAGMLVWGGTSQAQVVVRAPFVHVEVGPGGVYVQAPFVTVDVQKRCTVRVGNRPPVVGEPQPPPPMAPLGATPAPGGVRPMTVKDFAATFRPSEGTHQAVLVHPATGQPVNVQFTLPAGNPEVRVTGKKLEFDYGKTEVDIRFSSNGSVKVEYLE